LECAVSDNFLIWNVFAFLIHPHLLCTVLENVTDPVKEHECYTFNFWSPCIICHL